MSLREIACGKTCQVRLPGICNGDPGTTVLAHYRLIGYSGLGLRNKDLFGAWSCSSCHDAIDGRDKHATETYGRERLHLWHLHGVLRTQAELLKMGVPLA